VDAEPITDQGAKFSSFPRTEIPATKEVQRGTMAFKLSEEIFHLCFLFPEIAGVASNSWIFCSKMKRNIICVDVGRLAISAWPQGPIIQYAYWYPLANDLNNCKAG
jgi:hypothetical protein